MLARSWSDSIMWHSIVAVLIVLFIAWVAALSAGADPPSQDHNHHHNHHEESHHDHES